MSGPEVSVVLSVRDGGENLEAALDSVLSQEGVAFELVVVDDGSRDDTPRRLAARAQADSRLRVLAGAGDGLTAALRQGCAAANGAWIARQDASDRSLPGRLRRQLDAFRDRPRLGLVSCFTECVAPAGEALYVEKGRAAPDLERSLFDDPDPTAEHVGPSSHGSAMFRRDLYESVGGYRLEFPLGQDWDLWLRLGERATFLTIGETLYRRRLSSRSASFRLRALQFEFGAASTEASRLRRAGESEEPALERARRLSARWRRERFASSARCEARAFYHFGEVLRRRGDRASRSYFTAAIRKNPAFLAAWLRLVQSTALGTSGRTPSSERIG